MNTTYLEISYRKGRLLAAYLYLARRPGDVSAKTVDAGNGMLVDFHQDGRAIGIELTSPSQVTLAALNKTLIELGMPPAKQKDIAPLLAA